MSDLRKAAEALMNHWDAGEYKNCTGYMAGYIRALRQALDDKPPVKTYCGGRANYCTPEETPEVPCKTHPDAPHGFDRNASHSADRYVCECESWEPVDAVDTSQESVDETAKGEHEPLCYLRDDIDRPFGGFEHCDKDDAGAFPVYLAPPKKEWVGLTDQEIWDIGVDNQRKGGGFWGYPRALEAKLKEKNT